jgi:membrane peptidoglycan carboxypeptidase
MKRRTGTFATLCALTLSVVLAGALLAGFLLPWVGGPALAAQQSTSLLGEPPEELTDQPPAGNTTMLAANGDLITSFYRENRAPVTGDQIAEVMRQAIVAIEDARFYEHGGLDVQGTLRALITNLAAGGVQEGGSTLTQQLVKQTLLQSTDDPAQRLAATEQTIGRKVREARLALALEDKYSKDELLTRYLNIVYFGQNSYGIEPAAKSFFGVDAAALTLPQAASCRVPPTTTRSSTRRAPRSGATRCWSAWPSRGTSRRRSRPRRPSRPSACPRRPRPLAVASRRPSGPTCATSCRST